jgi:hypothetical protein
MLKTLIKLYILVASLFTFKLFYNSLLYTLSLIIETFIAQILVAFNFNNRSLYSLIAVIPLY